MSEPSSAAQTHYLRDGVLPILAASVLWALVYFFRKTALYGISPPFFTFANSVIGALSLWFFCRLELKETYKIFLLAPTRFLLLGLTGVSVGTTLMMVGLDRLDLGVSLVLEKLQPLFTWILAGLFLGERIRASQIPWVLMAVGGSYLVSAKEPWTFHLAESDAVGVAAVCGAALSWGISNVLGRALIQVNQDFRQITFLRFTVGAIFLLPSVMFPSLLGLRFIPDTYVISIVILSAVFGSTVGYILFYRGLRYVSATASAFLQLATPAVGILLGIVCLGEHLTLVQLLAIPCMLYAVYRLSRHG